MANKKKKSREYLEEALSAAKRMLPGWMYAVIHQAALPRSGGRARHARTQPATLEKVALGTLTGGHLRSLKGKELHSVWAQLSRWFQSSKRQGKSTDRLLRTASRALKEMRRRGINVSGSLAKACDSFAKGSGDGKKKKQTYKGFVNGEAEGGMHAHGLDRHNDKTLEDGAHQHLFILATGEFLVTAEDGSHAHSLSEDVTSNDGRHSHHVMLPNGDITETLLGGQHKHEAMVETTGVGGLHKHILRLADGTEIESVTPSEFVARMGINVPPHPMLTASEVVGALGQLNLVLAEQAIGEQLEADHPFELLRMSQDLQVNGCSVSNEAELTAELVKGLRADGSVRVNSGIVSRDVTIVAEVLEVDEFEKQDVPANIQTLVFSKEHFTEKEAVAWAKEHEFTADKVDETDESYRLRQVHPDDFRSGSFRTIDITDGVQAVIGRPKSAKATKAQSLVLGVQGDDGILEIEKAWSLAQQVEPGDVVEALVLDNQSSIVLRFSDQEPMTIGEVVKASDCAARVSKTFAPLAFHGDSDAKLVFVSATPSPVERARGEAVVGLDGEIFASAYLKPLGLTKKEVATGFSVPVEWDGSAEQALFRWRSWLEEELARFPHAKVVALGKTAKNSLGNRADFVLPHPSAIRRFGDRGEVSRKLKAISKAIDKDGHNETMSQSKVRGSARSKPPRDRLAETRSGEGTTVPVVKALEEKQIVYGVVLDPYQVDAHNDWIPPAQIEQTAHGFLKESRVVGFEHSEKANATVVESFVESYPTREDYLKALDNQPHVATRRSFGSDQIHSGAWVIGVELGADEWQAFKRGEINAFSIGGFSVKSRIDQIAMPKVEFKDLRGV